MEARKYSCNQCLELFDLIDSHVADKVRCPWCSSENVEELIACSLETGPPPWEYVCQHCNSRFRVAAPHGPSDEKKIRCPICKSSNIEWLAVVSEVCPPGG